MIDRPRHDQETNLNSALVYQLPFHSLVEPKTHFSALSAIVKELNIIRD